MSTETTTTPTGDGPVVVAGGDAPLLFDDMDFTLARPAKTPKRDTTDTKEVKEAKEPKEEPKKELTTDDTGKGKESKEAGKKEAKKDLEEAKDKEEKLQRKIHKAKWDKQEWDLDDEAELTVKVNGQDVPVKLNELMSNYSGKTNWNKQFQDLSMKRKEVDSLNSQLMQTNGKLKSIYSEQDPQKRIFLMSELAGMSPVEFRSKFLEDNIKMVEKYSTMSDAERQADAVSFENAYLKYQMDTKAKSEAQSQAQVQLQAKVEKLLTSHQITPDEFDSQDQVLEKVFKENKMDLKGLTPEVVIETILKDKLWFAAQPIFEKLQVNKTSKEMVDFVDKVYSHGLTPDQLPEIIDELYGHKKASKIVEEKTKQAQDFKEGVKHNPKKKEEDGVWSFEQMTI